MEEEAHSPSNEVLVWYRDQVMVALEQEALLVSSHWVAVDVLAWTLSGFVRSNGNLWGTNPIC
jgi:hypothetical protein